MKTAQFKNIFDNEKHHFWFVGRTKIILSVIDDVISDSMIRILDYGCGTGQLIRILQSVYKHKEIHGADISEQALTFCRKRGISNVIDLTQSTPAAEYYDMITSLDVVEHIENDVDFLKDISKLLRVNGVLILTVPAYNFLWSGNDYMSKHVRRYKRSDIQKKLIQAGFHIRKTSYFNTFLFLPILLVILYRKYFVSDSKTMSNVVHVDKTLNQILTSIFASERWFLKYSVFPFGVSILAIASKKASPGKSL